MKYKNIHYLITYYRSLAENSNASSEYEINKLFEQYCDENDLSNLLKYIDKSRYFSSENVNSEYDDIPF
jgi:predicted ATPase